MKHFSARGDKLSGFFHRPLVLERSSGASDDRKLDGQTSNASNRRRSYPIVSPVHLLYGLGRFLWSVMIRIFNRFRPITFLLLALLIGFSAGFVFFAEKVNRMQQPVLVDPADAIVVLTGGQSRIQTGVDLLRAKLGKRLLITGVNPNTNEKMLQQATHSDSHLFDCCVDLDRSAMNTIGNAAESERWVRANNYRRVIVVTNNYHMPRTVLEMSNRMPDVQFIAYPVVNYERRDQSWIAQGDTLRVLFTEYLKYLGAGVRVGLATVTGEDLLESFM